MKYLMVAMTDEARAAVRFNGPTEDQLLAALLSSDERSIPSSRHIRSMAAEILRSRGWKIRTGIIGKKSIANGILVSPNAGRTRPQISFSGVPTAEEALHG